MIRRGADRPNDVRAARPRARIGASAATRALTASTYRDAIARLSAQDARLAAIVTRHGLPPFWTQRAGFAGLTWAILGQQVSIESAQAAFDKLQALAGALTPAAFLALDDGQLKRAGFSRQKASYVRTMARQLLNGQLDLETLNDLPDDDARGRLIELRGVGRWTADTYLLFSLRRPDVWPAGDLALEKAVSDLAGSAARLDGTEVDRIAAHWTPWRAVAARLLWFQYLKQRGRAATAQGDSSGA